MKSLIRAILNVHAGRRFPTPGLGRRATQGVAPMRPSRAIVVAENSVAFFSPVTADRRVPVQEEDLLVVGIAVLRRRQRLGGVFRFRFQLHVARVRVGRVPVVFSLGFLRKRIQPAAAVERLPRAFAHQEVVDDPEHEGVHEERNDEHHDHDLDLRIADPAKHHVPDLDPERGQDHQAH